MRPRASWRSLVAPHLLLLSRFVRAWRANPKNPRNMLACLLCLQVLACVSCVGSGWEALGQRDRVAVASVGHSVGSASVRGSRVAVSSARRVVLALVGMLRR